MVAIRVADACVGGLFVARLHNATSTFTVDGSPSWGSRTFAAALATAALSTGWLAWWALSRPLADVSSTRVVARATVAGCANYGVWTVLMTLLAWPFWEGMHPPFEVQPYGVGTGMPTASLAIQLTSGWCLALFIALPLGTVFGLFHVLALRIVVHLARVRTLQPLAHARLFGAAWMLLAAGVAACLDRMVYAGDERWWWSVPASAGLAALALADLSAFALTEWRARLLLRDVLAGTSTRLRVASGEQVSRVGIIPLAPLGPRSIQLIAAASAPRFRVSGDADVVALIPGALAPAPPSD